MIRFKRVSDPGQASRIDVLNEFGALVADIVTGANRQGRRVVYVTIFRADGVHTRLERRSQATAMKDLIDHDEMGGL